MNQNDKQRCVMISADHGLAIVYFLQTDVVQTMLDEGIKVVVLTDDGVVEKVREKFGQEKDPLGEIAEAYGLSDEEIDEADQIINLYQAVGEEIQTLKKMLR